VWDKYGDGRNNAELARLHLALLLTLQGTPFLYNGEEIGMTNLVLTALDQIQDTAALQQYHVLTTQQGYTPEAAEKSVLASTRDCCRSPLQWDASPNAGFSPTDVQPWLPVNPNYANGINVAAQEDDPHSLRNFYRKLLRLRRNAPALIAGDYHALHVESETYFAFTRHDARSGQTCLIVLNFAEEPQMLNLDAGAQQASLLYTSGRRDDAPVSLAQLTLEPFEIFIAEL
jgi:alpha-glucosidase